MRSSDRRSKLGPAASGPFGLPWLAALVAVPLVADTLASKASGVLSGEFLIPPRVTDAFPACGQCHSQRPNTNGKVAVAIMTAARSIAAGSKIAVAVRVTGGPAKNVAGFSMETTAGAFAPVDIHTRVAPAGAGITHTNRFGNRWKLDFTAPAQPGLVRWTAAGNSVNGDGGTAGDSWGFWGPDSAVPGIPFRLFVNAPGIDAFGAGCAGTDGHPPILGAAEPARLGKTVRVECHNAPPQTVVLHAFGLSDKVYGPLPLPFDLQPLGAAGCFLRTDHVLVQGVATAGQGSGGGTASAAWTFPSWPALKGLAVYFQALVVDRGANALGVTTSNGLKSVLQ